ncbi:MAG: TlyA family RNA methyltransferase [Micropruina sp.]|uniref:TlyA family RNA methyltransferase n=1 Tax=Micropruina sp. TaxID=2737536 RepID=UPI0039E5C014
MTVRLDQELVRRGLARSRGQAADAVRSGHVQVNGRPAGKPATPVAPSDSIEVSVTDHYVSRAAHKLLGALDDSGLRVAGRVLDAGASTGGFTQVVLERGADPVYAVDVGHGQLAAAVRDDSRVVVREGLNLRDLSLDDLDAEPVDLIVGDVSFISLKLLLPALLAVLRPDGAALLLVKPQFEVGRGGLDARGVVRDEKVRRQCVDEVAAEAARLGRPETWRGVSRTPGSAGNVEWFVLLGGRPVPVGGPR